MTTASGRPGRESRLRILIVPEWYPSQSHATAGVFIRDQARAAARSHDVTVLVHDPEPRARRSPALIAAVEDGLRVLRVRTRPRAGTRLGRIAFLFVAARALRRLRRNGEPPDLIHGHVFSAGFLAILLARGRYPVVISEHHTDFVEGKVVGYDARVARFAFRHARLVCPVSSTLKACLEHLEPRGSYDVVPEVVDVEPFLGGDRGSRPRGRGKTRLLVVAILSAQKGVEYLLEALGDVHARRSDFTLDIVGDGPGRSTLEELAAARLPAGVVTFHGEQPRVEVASFMARSDVFVLPTLVETFCVVLIEALASGLPVITTTAVPDHERFEGRFGIVVKPRDAQALAQALLAMLEQGWSVNRDDAQEVVQSFGMDAVGRRWDEIYRRVAAAG